MLEQNDERVEKSSENTEETVSGTSKIEEIVSETAEENEVPDQSETILVDETTKAVQEIEKSVAEEAEKELEKKEEVAVVDFSIMSLDDLVSELSKVISSNPVQKIKSQVEAVKSEFNQKFGALLAEKKASFLAEGGNSIDFQFSSPIKSEYNKLLSDYKKERDAYYGDI
jgi:molybdopterin converting factor small subunit